MKTMMIKGNRGKDTNYGPIWSLVYVTPPTISNAGTYVYTGGYVGPDITSSSYYTVTGNKNVSGGSYAYTVTLNDKTAYRWTTGGTADITGTYNIAYAVNIVFSNSNPASAYTAFKT